MSRLCNVAGMPVEGVIGGEGPVEVDDGVRAEGDVWHGRVVQRPVLVRLAHNSITAPFNLLGHLLT